MMENNAKNAQQWSQNHYNSFKKYRGQWVAYNAIDGIIAHDKHVPIVMETAKALGKWFVLKYVNPISYAGLRRLASVRFRPLHTDVWLPNSVVTRRFKGNVLTLEMLVDPGADVSTLSLSTGIALGFEHFEGEVADIAAGVSGTMEYVLRTVELEIEGHVFKAPVAWILDESCEDLLLGREVVFDVFNVEFRQKDGEIIFKKRNDSV